MAFSEDEKHQITTFKAAVDRLMMPIAYSDRSGSFEWTERDIDAREHMMAWFYQRLEERKPPLQIKPKVDLKSLENVIAQAK